MAPYLAHYFTLLAAAYLTIIFKPHSFYHPSTPPSTELLSAFIARALVTRYTSYEWWISVIELGLVRNRIVQKSI